MTMSEYYYFNFPQFELNGPLVHFLKLWIWDGDIPCQPFDVVDKLRLFRGFSTKDAFDCRLHSELFIDGGLVSLFRSFKYDSISRLFHYEEKWKVNGLNM